MVILLLINDDQMYSLFLLQMIWWTVNFLNEKQENTETTKQMTSCF